MKKFLTVLLAICFVSVFSPSVSAEKRSLAAVTSWALQLQNIDTEELADSSYDLLVISPSRDGTGKHPFSREEISGLQKKGKIVLAYFPLEAEIFAPYWNPEWEVIFTEPCFEHFYREVSSRFEVRRCSENPKNTTVQKPSWVGPQNPITRRYRVKYWEEGWWETVAASYLKQIAAVGFDGVYVDTANSPAFWHSFMPQYTTHNLARDLTNLLGHIRHAGSASGNEFSVVLQGSLDTVWHLQKREREEFFKTLDGVTTADVLYHQGYMPASTKSLNSFLSLLRKFQSAGKILLNIEYISTAQEEEYLAKISARQTAQKDSSVSELPPAQLFWWEVRSRMRERRQNPAGGLRILPFRAEENRLLTVLPEE